MQVYIPEVKFSDLPWLWKANEHFGEEEFNKLMVKWLRDGSGMAKIRLMFCVTPQNLTDFRY